MVTLKSNWLSIQILQFTGTHFLKQKLTIIQCRMINKSYLSSRVVVITPRIIIVEFGCHEVRRSIPDASTFVRWSVLAAILEIKFIFEIFQKLLLRFGSRLRINVINAVVLIFTMLTYFPLICHFLNYGLLRSHIILFIFYHFYLLNFSWNLRWLLLLFMLRILVMLCYPQIIHILIYFT